MLCRQNLWNHLLHHYKDKGVVVEGPISNMFQSRILLPRLRKLDTQLNMLSLRFACMSPPGSGNNKDGRAEENNNNSSSNNIVGASIPVQMLPHDGVNMILPEGLPGADGAAVLANMAVPIGMFMNMAHIPPRYGVLY